MSGVMVEGVTLEEALRAYRACWPRETDDDVVREFAPTYASAATVRAALALLGPYQRPPLKQRRALPPRD